MDIYSSVILSLRKEFLTTRVLANDEYEQWKRGKRLKENFADAVKTMKICKRCFREFTEGENLYQSPAGELADIFLATTGAENGHDLCPKCREELGMLNLTGLGE